MTQNEVYGQLTSTLIEWSGLLKDPNYIRSNRQITWPNRETLFVPELLTRAYTRHLSRTKQYTLQIAYTYNSGGDVEAARLGYFEVGDDLSDADAVTTSVDDGVEDDEMRWMRIDFTSAVTAQALHASCHLHLSGHPNVRIALGGLPSPAQFVEFTLATFYSSQYAAERLDEHGNFLDVARVDAVNSRTMRAGDAPESLLRRIPHMRFPGF